MVLKCKQAIKVIILKSVQTERHSEPELSLHASLQTNFKSSDVILHRVGTFPALRVSQVSP